MENLLKLIAASPYRVMIISPGPHDKEWEVRSGWKREGTERFAARNKDLSLAMKEALDLVFKEEQNSEPHKNRD